MTQVDFYILREQGEQERLGFACRLVEKALGQGLRIYIHTPNENAAQDIDDLLWSFKPDSFIPHAIIGVDAELTDDEEIPVFIGFGDQHQEGADLLINLAVDIPGFYADFSRIAEIVPNSESAKARLRENWSTYKQRGFELKHHEL